MLWYLASALGGAFFMLVALAVFGRMRRGRQLKAANSIVHTKESAVAIVQSKGGKKRVIHSH